MILSVLVLLSVSARAAEPPSLPDPIMTPGAVDPAATWNVVCNGTTRSRRHVSAAMKAAVLAGYNIPDSESPFYEIDHLVPLAIGDAKVVANLWPEPWAEAVQKDVLEVELQRRVCHGLLPQARRSARSRTIGRPPTRATLAACRSRRRTAPGRW